MIQSFFRHGFRIANEYSPKKNWPESPETNRKISSYVRKRRISLVLSNAGANREVLYYISIKSDGFWPACE